MSILHFTLFSYTCACCSFKYHGLLNPQVGLGQPQRSVEALVLVQPRPLEGPPASAARPVLVAAPQEPKVGSGQRPRSVEAQG